MKYRCIILWWPRRMRCVVHVQNGKEVNAYRVLAGKYERKGSPGRLRDGWEGNIKKDLKETSWADAD
jgi:hypothetical protein